MNLAEPVPPSALMPPPDAFPPQAPPSPRAPLSRSGPARQSSSAISPTQMNYDQRASLGLAPVDSNSIAGYMYSPRTSVVSGIIGAPPANPGNVRQGSGSRTSMQDAAVDVLQSTYPPFQPPTKPTTHSGSVPLFNLGDRPYVGKGKGRASPINSSQPQSASKHSGFWFTQGIGYVCVMCNKICHQPSHHRTSTGGGGCVDVGMPAIPLEGFAAGATQSGGHREQQQAPVELDATFSVVSQGRSAPLMRENVNPAAGQAGPPTTDEEMPFGFTSIYKPLEDQPPDPAVLEEQRLEEEKKQRRRSVTWRDSPT